MGVQDFLHLIAESAWVSRTFSIQDFLQDSLQDSFQDFQQLFCRDFAVVPFNVRCGCPRCFLDVLAKEGRMNEFEVTWSRVLEVWWSLAWRGVTVGIVAGLAANFVLGIVGVPDYGKYAGAIAGFLGGIWAVRTAIRTSYSDFRIVLVPLEDQQHE